MVEKALVLLQLLLQFSLPLLKLFLAESVDKAYIRDWQSGLLVIFVNKVFFLI